MWLSWPQACIMPTSWPVHWALAVDLTGRPLSGSAAYQSSGTNFWLRITVSHTS